MSAYLCMCRKLYIHSYMYASIHTWIYACGYVCLVCVVMDIPSHMYDHALLPHYMCIYTYTCICMHAYT